MPRRRPRASDYETVQAIEPACVDSSVWRRQRQHTDITAVMRSRTPSPTPVTSETSHQNGAVEPANYAPSSPGPSSLDDAIEACAPIHAPDEVPYPDDEVAPERPKTPIIRRRAGNIRRGSFNSLASSYEARVAPREVSPCVLTDIAPVGIPWDMSSAQWQSPSETPPPTAPAALVDSKPLAVPHEEYYLDDGIVFRVEETLFKVPRYMFTKDSSRFSKLYDIPDPADTSLNGNSDTNPIILHEVSTIDFVHILQILYPLTIFSSLKCAELWTEKEWKPIFLLAHLWQLPDLCEESKLRLKACANPFTKISIGRSAGVPEFLREGLAEITVRGESLTEEEGDLLERSDIFMIARARERIRSEVVKLDKRGKWSQTSYGECYVYAADAPPFRSEAYAKHRGVHDILDQVFGLEPCDGSVKLTEHPAGL